MKFFKKSLPLLSLLLLIGHLKADTHPVRIFSSDNFRGNSSALYSDWSANHRFDAWNDAINSVIVPRGYEAILFEHAHFKGNYLVVRGEWSSRGNHYWCNRISSIQIVPIDDSYHGRGHVHRHGNNRRYDYGHGHESRSKREVHTCGPACSTDCDYLPAPVITIFEHTQFGGAAQEVRGDWSVHDSRDFWNDRISSIYVPRGYAAVLYEHEHFQGRSIIIEGLWTTYASQDFWNDRVSSIRVIRQ